MKTIFAASLSALLLTPTPPDVSVYGLLDPTFGNDLLVVVDCDGKDAAALWDAEDEELQEVRTAAGQVLEPSVFGLDFLTTDDVDPTRKGFEKIEDGRTLLVFKFKAPSEKVKSIPRFAGTYKLLHGGVEHWVDMPFEKLAEAAPWKDKALVDAGFEVEQGVREIKVIQVKLSGEIFDVQDCVVIAKGAEDELNSAGSSGDFDAIEYSFDLSGEEPEELTVRITLEEGTVVDVEGVPRKAKYKKIKNATLAKADIAIEVRETPVLEAFAQGKGSFDLLRGYRWVDKRGKRLEIWPSSSASGGGTSITTACRVPADLPRGAKLQMGVLVDAEWETVSFEYEVKVRE